MTIWTNIYRSQNGDSWWLVRDDAQGRLTVRHEANRSSGGHVTELGISEFLNHSVPGPEHAALEALMAGAASGSPWAERTRHDPLLADAADRALSASTGHIPPGGIAPLVPELDVTDLAASLRFWCGLAGFDVAYDRPAARFAYLARGPLQVMLCEHNGAWETGDLVRPFGRGINLQMTVEAIEPLLETLRTAAWPLFRPPAEAWYKAGDEEHGVREFLVQDPDGYLLRFAEVLGARAPTRTGHQDLNPLL